MANFTVFYPPFTQPAMVYPAPYVVGEAAKQNGFNPRVVDLNAKFFLYLDKLSQKHCSKKDWHPLHIEVDKLNAVRRLRNSSSEPINIDSGFVKDFQDIVTYSDQSRYLRTAQKLHQALWCFGRICGYQNLHLDTFQADAKLENIESVARFVEELFSSQLGDFFRTSCSKMNLSEEPVLALSAAFRSQLIPCLVLGKVLKELYSGGLVIVGGAAITCLKEDREVLSEFSDCFDLVSFGASPDKAFEIVKNWYRGVQVSPDVLSPDVLITSSLKRSQAGELCENRSEDPWLLTYTQFLLDKVEAKNYCDPKPVLPLPSARGCYWNKCTFCFEYGNDSKGLISDSSLVAQCMEEAIKHGFNRFFIGEGAVPPELAKGLGEEIRHRKLSSKWYGFFRLEKGMTTEVIQAMAGDGGCKLALYGLESGSQRIQKEMKKGVLLHLASKVLEASANAGVWNHVLLMYGYPSENEEEAQQTLRYLRDHRTSIHSVAAAVFTLDKASQLYLEGRNEIFVDKLSDRNRAGLDYFVGSVNRNGFDPEAYRAQTLKYANNNLRMDRIAGLMHGHELWFHSKVIPESI